jgi:hypothetical protein
MRADAQDIGRMVSMPQLLRALGVQARSSRRADCPLCRGRSKGTLAHTDCLWHCHRCNEGGDVFSLVRGTKHCDFPAALRFVAGLAGICLEDCRSADFQREPNARRRQRERVQDGAKKLSALEHGILRECRDRIHTAERTRLRVSWRLEALARGEPERFRGEQDGLWLTLQVAVTLLGADLPVYTMLSFGALDERARFVLHPELRDAIIADVRWAGYVRTPDGKAIEVLK